MLFEEFRKGYLCIKLNKCMLLRDALVYLGLIMSKEGLCIDLEKIKASLD